MTSPRIDQHPHRVHWDTRYRDAFQPRAPSALLRRWLDVFPLGVALDVACGTGRNALLLAEHGWRVVGIDISPVGLKLARTAATKRGLSLDLAAVDLGAWPLPKARFDLVCVFRFLDRALCPALAEALRPGGALIYETFTVAQRGYAGGPRSDAQLLQPGELPRLFPALRVLEYYEDVVDEDARPRALAGFVGRRGAAQ